MAGTVQRGTWCVTGLTTSSLSGPFWHFVLVPCSKMSMAVAEPRKRVLLCVDMGKEGSNNVPPRTKYILAERVQMLSVS